MQKILKSIILLVSTSPYSTRTHSEDALNENIKSDPSWPNEVQLFPINTGGHWILVSLQKIVNKKNNKLQIKCVIFNSLRALGYDKENSLKRVINSFNSELMGEMSNNNIKVHLNEPEIIFFTCRSSAILKPKLRCICVHGSPRSD